MKNKTLLGIFSFVLVFGILLAGCPDDVKIVTGAKAAAPTIVSQPSYDGSEALLVTDPMPELTVVASASDGGELSYQWYSSTSETADGAVVPGATNSTYTPVVTPDITGTVTYYYYVVVTNTQNNTTATVASDRVKIIVDPVDAVAPVITDQSRSVSGNVNSVLSSPLFVTATVSDGGVLSYEWYENTTSVPPITNAVSANYMPPAFPMAASYYYYVKVTNTKNETTATVTSELITVTVNKEGDAEFPVISQQPVSANYVWSDAFNTSGVTTLSVTAVSTDGGVLSYEWYRNATASTTGGDEVGEITAAYKPDAPVDDGVGDRTYYYYVEVTNHKSDAAGEKDSVTTSALVTINVTQKKQADKPAIAAQPVGNEYNYVGPTTIVAPLSVTVTPSADGVLSYQWYSNTSASNTGGTAITDATNAVYEIGPNPGTFHLYVVVTNTNTWAAEKKTTTASNAVTVKINQLSQAAAPVIGTQPASKTYQLNAATVDALSVEATVSDAAIGGSLSYQWYSNTTASNSGGTLINGATGATYATGINAASEQTYYYYVVVTNTNNWAANTAPVATTSSVATIKITTLVPITTFAIKTDPITRKYTLAGWNEATSAAKAMTVVMEEDSPAIAYQWYSNSTNGEKGFFNTGGTLISGATNASYTPTNITAVGEYNYYVTATYEGQTLTSQPVQVRIVSTANAGTVWTIGSDRINYVRGLGGTGAFMFRQGSNADPSPEADENYIDMLMGVLGVNVLRVMVQDDFLNYLDNKVQDGNNPVYYHDAKANFISSIKRVNELGGYVFANPWSPPANLKNNNSVVGGNNSDVKTSSYVAYANHLRSFVKHLYDNGAPIFAVGMQNEPDVNNSTYENCNWTATQISNWFRTVGHWSTQRVTNESGAGVGSSLFETNIIQGYGGGGPTHHVLTMADDCMGNIGNFYDTYLASTGSGGSNDKIEVLGRHYYAGSDRYVKAVGTSTHANNKTAAPAWTSRPQNSYTGPQEEAALAFSPQMYAPGSAAGSIKREVWQTEHDFNYSSASVTPPSSNPHKYWNSTFAAMNDIDWAFRVNGESVFDWWFSSSYSGFVTSYYANTKGVATPYSILPRGRGAAHYGRYVAETWTLNGDRTSGTVDFNTTWRNDYSNSKTNFNAGSTSPKISAFEDVNGEFISIVMFTPPYSTAGANGGSIGPDFGAGGTNGNDDPTRGSTNVGRIQVVLPSGFTATSATAMRSYGDKVVPATPATWDTQAAGKPRFWITEPVAVAADGKSVEVTLPGGNIISIKVMGTWPGRTVASPKRVRPFNQANADVILNKTQNRHNLTTSSY